MTSIDFTIVDTAAVARLRRAAYNQAKYETPKAAVNDKSLR